MAKAFFAAVVLGFSVIVVPLSRADPSEETASASGADSNYVEGRKALDAKNWKAAIELLHKASMQDDRNPDIHNFLGYAYRNAGEIGLAFKHYEKALQINPRHRGAHEYVGEAYLLINNLPKAEEHLAALQKICLISCEEYEDLKRAIADHSSKLP
jgi:Flp pilus assembly protein TadD